MSHCLLTSRTFSAAHCSSSVTPRPSASQLIVASRCTAVCWRVFCRICNAAQKTRHGLSGSLKRCELCQHDHALICAPSTESCSSVLSNSETDCGCSKALRILCAHRCKLSVLRKEKAPSSAACSTSFTIGKLPFCRITEEEHLSLTS